MANGVFQEVYMNYLLASYTHDDIDALFGQWSMSLWKHDYPIIPLLMKFFMDGESIPMILHLIKEAPDFKGFIESCTIKKATLWKDTPLYKCLDSTRILMVGLLCDTSITASM